MVACVSVGHEPTLIISKHGVGGRHATAFHGDVAVLRYLRSRGAVMKASTSRLGDTRLVHFAALSSLMLCGSSQRSAALTLTEFPTSIACALPHSVGTTLLLRIA